MKLKVPPTRSIPAGRFAMGLPACPPDATLARRWPQRREVPVQSFALGLYPVTNAEYRAYVEAAGAEAPRSMTLAGLGDDQQPVGGVSWLDAVAYCQWLSRQTGSEYRLPTDAEWEYAARGGRVGACFPWGDALQAECAWFGGREATLPVGSFPPNGFGLYDLVGNVWEWCGDRFNDVSGGVPATNAPGGQDPRDNRVLRGGSYLTRDPLNLWVAYRHEDPPDLRHACIGFRVARSPDPSDVHPGQPGQPD